MTKMQVDRELVIQAIDGGCEIALLENKELVEFYRDIYSSAITIGDIYWARVKKIMPPLNAVFVDIGENKEAFLHYTDLGENFSTFQSFFKKVITKESLKVDSIQHIEPYGKDGKIGDVLAVNDYLAVQILKEPMNTKGARMSADISIAGRYLVLTPFNNQLSVSKKIQNYNEKDRLRAIIDKMTTKNMGVIVRTVAEGKSLKDIHEDYLELVEKWETMCKQIVNIPSIVKLHSEESKSNTFLRDVLNDSFTKIHVNDEVLSSSIRSYIQKIAPDKIDIVKSHSNKLLFEEFSLTSKIKSSFNRIIPLRSGGYIIIEHTEAMCVIDVNSGVHKSKRNDVEASESILKLNLEAAKEIARQLRLRDIGGIIIVDFIDSKDSEIKDKICDEMHEFMRADKAKHTILPLSKFCLMQITRSRTKQQESVVTSEVCPSCNGSGKISSVVIITDMIYNQIQTILQIEKDFTLIVHPFVYAYLNQGLISEFIRWQWKLKTRLKMKINSNIGVNEYYFEDKNSEKLIF